MLKKKLFFPTFFFVLGVLLISPLHAMIRDNEETKKNLTVSKKKTALGAEEVRAVDLNEDIWVTVATFIDVESQDDFRWTSQLFYKCSEAAFGHKNRAFGHYQWAEFKMSEKILPKFNDLVIEHIWSNLKRLAGCPSRNTLEQYTKNYERLENFQGLPEKSFFKYFLKAQHLYLWKEKLAAEEMTLPPEPGYNTFYLGARRHEQASKLKDINIALPLLEEELIKKKDELFKENPFPLNLNEIGLSYLKYFSTNYVDSEQKGPEKKSITFESYLTELGHNLSAEQKNCSIVKVFTFFETPHGLLPMNGIHVIKDNSEDREDREDSEDSEDRDDSMDFNVFGSIQFNTLDL